MNYRHELKFLVSDRQLEVIRYRLKILMKQDAHQKRGIYMVRSLYFDDLNDSYMQENEDGIDNRRKFRIRIYEGDTSLIHLEKKMKYRGMTRKIMKEISKEDCLIYMSGYAPGLKPESDELEKEIFVQIHADGLHPVSIVEYERTAFVEPRGNVRITFDRNISGNEKTEAFLERKLSAAPLLPQGKHVLEVKYDELLPEYISCALEMGTLQRSSYSKYYYSRNYKNA